MRNILVFLAGFILTLHSIIPHTHHKTSSHQSHISTSNSIDLLDLLCAIFDEDIGENHLEDFPVQSNAFPLAAEIIENPFQQPLHVRAFTVEPAWYTHQENLFRLLLPNSLLGRAPPVSQ